MNLELTEREADHLLLSLEGSMRNLHEVNAVSQEEGLPHTGTRRAFRRFDKLHMRIAAMVDDE